CEDPAGDRGGVHAYRERHLRHVPRLRRGDRRSAAEGHSVDPCLHHVQGKTEFVTDLLALLQQFHREKLAMFLRHEDSARFVSQYDANNTYQYIINREDVQLSWLATAIAELGGTVPDTVDPHRLVSAHGRGAAPALFDEDARDAQALVDKWQARIPAMTNARHAKM